MIKRMPVRESVVLKHGASPGIVKESFLEDPPLVIFPEIRAITADKVTRNFTYYPAETLIGNPSLGSGITSFTYPYPIPVIQDHDDMVPPYGRVYNAGFVSETNGTGWIRAVAAITDPWAISMVLSRRFLTVSIGGMSGEIYCSVCLKSGLRINMAEEGICQHVRGETYDGVLCYWIFGDLYIYEISFVNIPSDDQAHVVNPNLDVYEAGMYLAGTDGAFLLDLATGSTEPAEECLNKLGISKLAYKRIVQQAAEARARDTRTTHMFVEHLHDRDFVSAVGSNLKGLKL